MSLIEILKISTPTNEVMEKLYKIFRDCNFQINQKDYYISWYYEYVLPDNPRLKRKPFSDQICMLLESHHKYCMELDSKQKKYEKVKIDATSYVNVIEKKLYVSTEIESNHISVVEYKVFRGAKKRSYQSTKYSDFANFS